MNISSLRRAGRMAALVTTAVATPVLVAPGADAASFRGVINTPGGVDQAVWTVEAAGHGYHAWKHIPDGTGVYILCQTPGTEENGTYGPSPWWDFLSNGGMVPHTNVTTGTPWIERLASVPRCTFTTNPADPEDEQYTFHQAIDRAFTRLGDTSFEGRCLAFVAEAYGHDRAGWDNAEIAGTYVERNGLLRTDKKPPRGALVWYHNSSGTGHVMLSLGEGYLIGISVNGRLGLANNVDYRTGYRGWSIPYFPNAGPDDPDW